MVDLPALQAEELATDGLAVLPALTAEELAVLGEAGVSPLRDEREIGWWAGLDDPVRAALTQSVRRGLVARGVLPQAPADGALDGAVAALLAVRSNPAWLALAVERGASVDLGLRLSAAGETDPPWLLVERVTEGVHTFAAASPDTAARHVAEWLAGRSDRDVPPSRIAAQIDPQTVLRTLEVMRPGPGGEGPARQRIAVQHGGGGLAIVDVRADGELGAPRLVELAELVDLVAAAFTDPVV